MKTENGSLISAVDFINQGSGVVTLCGSTKYFFEYMRASQYLTFKNWMVLTCGSFGHSFHKYDEGAEGFDRDYAVVKKLHFQKILLSHCIVVVSDLSMYIGSSTKAEINFAIQRGIPVFYFDGEQLTGETNILPVDNLSDTSIIDNFAVNNSLGF